MERMKQWKKPLVLTIAPIVLGSGLAMVDGVIFDESTAEATSTTYTVIASNLTVRSTPNTNGEVLGSVKEGESVSVIEKGSNGWYKINYNGRTGYVSSVYLKANTSTSTATNTSISTYTVTGNGVNVRSTADTSSTVLGTVNKGESVSVIEKNSNGWYKINYNGRTGYISSVYLEANTSTNATTSTATSTATSTTTSTSASAYTVTGSRVNVRSTADTSGTVLGTVNTGETVSVVEKESNGWYKISYNGQIGYIHGAYIEEYNGSSSASNVSSTGSTYVSAVNILNVRDTPSTDGKILGALTKGQSLSVVEKGSDGWYKINYNGQIGYVSGQFVQSAETTNSSYSPLYKKTIVLDAGHGGSDPGTIGLNNLYEKDITLAVVQRLARLLEKDGAVVILTRSADVSVPLSQRASIANRSGGDAFLSVHTNSATSPLVSGIETYSYNQLTGIKTGMTINKSSGLASSIQSSMVSALGSNNRGAVHGNYYVLRETQIAGALAEIGFLSNAEEASKLASDSYLDKVAYSLYSGLKNYFRY